MKAPRGFGILTNPKKAIYNRIYYRTTFGLRDLLRTRRRPKKLARSSKGSGCGCIFLVIVVLAFVGFWQEYPTQCKIVLGVLAGLFILAALGRKKK